MLSLKDFKEVKVENLVALVGGNKTSISIGGRHKNQTDTVSDDGTVTWENGDKGHIVD